MNTICKLIIASALPLCLLSSCIDGIVIDGNEDISEECRTIPDFTKIYSSGSFNVFYTHADTSGVKIICESNLLPYIETAVFNHKLDIQFANHVSVYTHHDIDIYVSSPEIESIHLDGSGEVVADSISASKAEISLSGSGNIYANFYGHYFESTISGSGTMDIYGECDTLKTEISGSGNIGIETYDCRQTTVTISGSGNAELKGNSETAKYTIIGSGKIKAYNFPVEVADIILSGSGNIYANVTAKLDAIISGSGSLYYIGNPRINYSDLGSGSLINDN